MHQLTQSYVVAFQKLLYLQIETILDSNLSTFLIYAPHGSISKGSVSLVYSFVLKYLAMFLNIIFILFFY